MAQTAIAHGAPEVDELACKRCATSLLAGDARRARQALRSRIIRQEPVIHLTAMRPATE
jgi:hypothetical protein